VQPHSSVGLEGLGANYRWIRIPSMIYTHVGLPANICSPREFCSFFQVDDPTAQDSHTCSVRVIVCICYQSQSIHGPSPNIRQLPGGRIFVHIPLIIITCVVHVNRGRGGIRHTTGSARVYTIGRRYHTYLARHRVGTGPSPHGRWAIPGLVCALH